MLLEPLVRDDPQAADYRGGLARTYLVTGQTHLDEDDPAGASAALRQAVGLYDGLMSPDGEQAFYRACCHAGLARLAGRTGSGISAGEGQAESDRAMSWLRRAVALGFRNPYAYRRETALDPLRDRDDFRCLMMDLAMPVDAFAS